MNSAEPKYLKRQIHCHQYLRSRVYFFSIFIKYIFTFEFEYLNNQVTLEWLNLDPVKGAS